MRENQVLMTLEYLREYRTYFHIGQSWGLDESNVYRIIQKIERRSSGGVTATRLLYSV